MDREKIMSILRWALVLLEIGYFIVFLSTMYRMGRILSIPWVMETMICDVADVKEMMTVQTIVVFAMQMLFWRSVFILMTFTLITSKEWTSIVDEIKWRLKR